jgi:hypothetical protein
MKRLLFISFISITLISCEHKKLLEEIYEEPGYAIGTITKNTSIAYVITHYYDYQVNGTSYQGKKKGGVSNDSSIANRMIGRQYLVVYKISDPSKSDLNFQYHISNEQEFLELIEKFKINPPKPK